MEGMVMLELLSLISCFSMVLLLAFYFFTTFFWALGKGNFFFPFVIVVGIDP